MHAVIPHRWKHAYVTPILKTSPNNLASNYRPISLTSVFCRTFEKILKAELVKYIETNGILPENQHGFRVKRSTEISMLSALNDWTKALDANNDIDIIYLDFSKAFDKVPFKELVQKLQTVGVHHRIIAWIKGFITNRTFQVKVNDSFSDTYTVTSGVPQGGVLSPVLFIIYTSDLPDQIDKFNVKCSMFADDVKLYKNISKPEDCLALQGAIKEIADWSDKWKLPLSASKTKLLHLGKSKTARYNYMLGGTRIVSVDTLRDLGFIMDKKLTFTDHCEGIAKRAERIVYNIFKSLSIKSAPHFLIAYKSYVRPVLEYGTTVFSPHLKSSIQRLEAVQNGFTRKLWIRLYGYDYTTIPSASNRNKIFKISSLETRRKRNDLLMIFKMITELVALKLDEFYTLQNSNTRGSQRKIHFSKAKSSIRASFFTQRAGSEFLIFSKKYALPNSLAQFKRLVDRYLLE